MKWLNVFKIFGFRKEREFKAEEGVRYYAETTFGTNPADRDKL